MAGVEAGLAQTFHHILARFQNRRARARTRSARPPHSTRCGPGGHPLRHRREPGGAASACAAGTASTGAEYGLHLVGRAVPDPGHFVESDTQVRGVLPHAPHEAHQFHMRDDDMTVNADAFRVHTALRDTHLVLAEGAATVHDLPAQARR